MKINYKKYVAFPYTVNCLYKTYTKKTLDKWSGQLAFLLQNGFTLEEDAIEDSFMMYNNFESYEDFEDLLASWHMTVEGDPTEIGHKLFDSVIDVVIKNSAWALDNFIDIKTMGKMYKSKIEQMLNVLQMFFDSSDLEIVRVKKSIPECEEADNLVDVCLELLASEKYNALLVKYQALYSKVFAVHKKLNRALCNKSNKGRATRNGNINDEIYGSAGGYNPTTSEIIVRNGSTVYELKTLCDKSKTDLDLRIKMRVLAKECLENGETDKLLVDFANGDDSKLAKVRKVLKSICFSGIMVLLELKHGLTLFEGDTLNNERAKNIALELKAICDFTGFQSKELAD